ncbi:MAG: FkbM family methyltransferase [Candidatus Dojkabacteria bacterium]|jgi:FkbM family methyltransferase|nr:FkbM family methyltransferase [Candidatus Dojkabacteria bacterium]
MEQTKLGKFTVLFPNGREYHFLKREVWNQESYFFKSNNPQPFIVDIGSHIGISVLYFKSIYPKSKILAFEPNPYSFDILNENIHINGLEDIKTVNMAVSSKIGDTVLHIDATINGWESNSSLMEGSWNGRENTKGIPVQSTTLDSYLKNIMCIDMLKIDTEGSELDILKSHRKILPKVENISVEYHPVRDRKIKKLLDILKEYFLLEIYMDGKLLKNIPDNKLLTIQGKKRE